MGDVWLHFSGLRSGEVLQDLNYLSAGKARRIKVEHTSRTEVSGRFQVEGLETAKQILRNFNYTVINSNTVRLWLCDEYLKHCTLVVIEGIHHMEGEDGRLHKYCQEIGLVCKLETNGRTARVWMDQDMSAQSVVSSIRMAGYFGTQPQAYIEAAENELIILDDDDDSSADESGSKAMAVDSRPSNVLQTKSKPRTSIGASTLALSTAGTPSTGAARKSTTKRPGIPRRADDRKGKVVRTGSTKIGNPPGRRPAGRLQSARQRRNSISNSAIPMSIDDQSMLEDDQKYVRNILDMEEWRAKAPFIYEFIYRRVPEETACDDGCCLSMAWCIGEQNNTMNCFLSQGSVSAASLVRDWLSPGPASDEASSAITMTAFEIPKRGQMANIKSLLGAFNSNEVSILHKNLNKDDYQHAISSLQLYDEGRILFGCTMQSVIVWSTDMIKQKESLLLIDDIDGVYDVGRDYVVANSSKGEVGVWKSGSRNYIWRYNDTRKFRDRSMLFAGSPRITALQVAASDMGAYVGSTSGHLSYCDFRTRYIEMRTSEHRGILKCIELSGEHGILTGTYDGELSLIDSRFMRAGGRTSELSVVERYHTPFGSNPITNIRVCPHDSNAFACSVDTNVYIYCKEPSQGYGSLLFNHKAHQTQVTDFSWHPDPEFQYTIGSTEVGTTGRSGELQIWRPSGIIL
ncbi:hypothetical protein H4R24_002143 [Coemansia sp. RSA 988]|nr:hypothetical protein H4R24_002143 [Coemansia sp. RSA 988]